MDLIVKPPPGPTSASPFVGAGGGALAGSVAGPLGSLLGAGVGGLLGAVWDADERLPTHPEAVGDHYSPPTEVHGKTGAFISFAREDTRFRDLFVGQSRNRDSTWDMADHSLHAAFPESWKTQARDRIGRAHVVIQLVTRNIAKADGAKWEVVCGHELGVPAFGVWMTDDDHGFVPDYFDAKNVIPWKKKGVAKMIRLAKEFRDSQSP